MIRNRTPDHNFGCLPTRSVDNALWKADMIGNTNAAIMVVRIEAWFIRKNNVVPISLPGFVLISQLQTQPPMVCREEDSVWRHSWTLSTVQQTSTNWWSRNYYTCSSRPTCCQEDAERSFTAMWNRCWYSRAEVAFSRLPPVFQVVWFLSVHCFLIRLTMELFSCGEAAFGRY